MLIRNVHSGSRGPLGDVRITNDRVSALGAELAPQPGEEVLDAEGAVLLPGLWDAHVHSVQWAAGRQRLDVSGSRSATEAVDMVVAQLRERPATDTVAVGFGFRPALWPSAPHKEMLESALPGRAVVLYSQDLHTGWFSPAALALVGAEGHPDGVLTEQECYQASAVLPQATTEQLDAWVADAMRSAAARGVVGIIDFEYTDNVADWQRRMAQYDIPLRVSCSIPRHSLADAISRGLRTGQRLASHLEVGPVKLFVDGSLNTRTAYCVDPYPGEAGQGSLETPLDELSAVMAEAARHGIHPAVHAIGDLANTIALDAFAQLRCPGRIEHAQLVSTEDFARFAMPGLIAGVQPAHAPDDRDVAERLWPGRTHRAFPYADLVAAGARIELGSDAPVAPADPWDGIASAVARTDDDRPPWHPEQALTIETALAASSRGRSGIRVGDVADLVLVADDPATLEADRLRLMSVRGTLLAGTWTYGPLTV